jgi:hypothetical protein
MLIAPSRIIYIDPIRDVTTAKLFENNQFEQFHLLHVKKCNKNN